jgi:hypothetical protein
MPSAEEYRSKLGGFDKLTTINYPQWSSIIEFILKSHNAWEIVQGNEAQPPAGNAAAARALTADYNKRSGEAAAAIRLSCSHDVAGRHGPSPHVDHPSRRIQSCPSHGRSHHAPRSIS